MTLNSGSGTQGKIEPFFVSDNSAKILVKRATLSKDILRPTAGVKCWRSDDLGVCDFLTL